MTKTKYGELTKAGHQIDVYLDKEDRRTLFVIEVSKNGKWIRREVLPLEFEPKFGVDIADDEALQKELQRIIRAL